MTSLTTDGVKARLIADHDELDAFLDQLIAAYQTGDRGAAASAYQELEARLKTHFSMEEGILFPEFARVEPREADELRAEHAAIRARLDELGVGVDLHQTRLPAMRELAQRLREHAARENEAVYRWADRVFSDPARREFLERALAHGRVSAAAEAAGFANLVELAETSVARYSARPLFGEQRHGWLAVDDLRGVAAARRRDPRGARRARRRPRRSRRASCRATAPRGRRPPTRPTVSAPRSCRCTRRSVPRTGSSSCATAARRVVFGADARDRRRARRDARRGCRRCTMCRDRGGARGSAVPRCARATRPRASGRRRITPRPTTSPAWSTRRARPASRRA